jgi:hypothetical protein
MKLSDATEKIPATPGIDPGTFRHVAQCLNHYATPGLSCPISETYSNKTRSEIHGCGFNGYNVSNLVSLIMQRFRILLATYFDRCTVHYGPVPVAARSMA